MEVPMYFRKQTSGPIVESDQRTEQFRIVIEPENIKERLDKIVGAKGYGKVVWRGKTLSYDKRKVHSPKNSGCLDVNIDRNSSLHQYILKVWNYLGRPKGHVLHGKGRLSLKWDSQYLYHFQLEVLYPE